MTKKEYLKQQEETRRQRAEARAEAEARKKARAEVKEMEDLKRYLEKEKYKIIKIENGFYYLQDLIFTKNNFVKISIERVKKQYNLYLKCFDYLLIDDEEEA